MCLEGLSNSWQANRRYMEKKQIGDEVSDWRKKLPTYDFIVMSMRMFGYFIGVSSLPFGFVALFSLLQPVFVWIHPQYEVIPITIDGQAASPWDAFCFVWRVASVLCLMSLMLLLPTYNRSFQSWLKALTKDSVFTGHSGGE